MKNFLKNVEKSIDKQKKV